MKLSRQTVLLIVMCGFILAGAFFYFLILPLQKETEALQEELRREQSFLTALTRASVEKRQQPKVSFTPQYQEKIPESPYLEQLMLDMTQVETISGVDMEGIGLSDKGAEENQEQQAANKQELRFPPIGSSATDNAPAYPGLESVTITTKIKGTYQQIHRFFEEALSLPRVIRVERVKISGGKDNFIYLNPKEDARQEMTAEVTLSAYYAPQLKSYFPQPLPVIVPPPEGRKNPFQ
jgi:type IV pilus assembly protein PilO